MKRSRIPLLLFAASGLVAGVLAGLVRLGWNFTALPVAAHHGAIMVGGFLGTLIITEKIIPLRIPALYAVPALSGTSVIAFIAGFPQPAFALLIAASAGLVIVSGVYLRREPSLVYVLMFAGCCCWLAGNISIAWTHSYPAAARWWISFFLLVISSERLELMKFLPVREPQKIAFAIVLLLFALAGAYSFHGPARAVSAILLLLSAVWLLRFDVIGISIRKDGLTRFIAVALLSGYAWLVLSAVLMISITAQPHGYDAFTHAFFIGFVFSMIFAHGPVILPGVLGIQRKPYHRLLYAALTLLHASLILRIASGLLLLDVARMWSGLLTAAAIIAYFATVVAALRQGRAGERTARMFIHQSRIS